MPKALKAVHDDDLLAVLGNLDVLTKFEVGKVTCAFCGDVLSLDNLHSIFSDSGAIKLSCTKPTCVARLISKFEEKHYA